jgi:hypothetical protein
MCNMTGRYPSSEWTPCPPNDDLAHLPVGLSTERWEIGVWRTLSRHKDGIGLAHLTFEYLDIHLYPLLYTFGFTFEVREARRSFVYEVVRSTNNGTRWGKCEVPGTNLYAEHNFRTTPE